MDGWVTVSESQSESAFASNSKLLPIERKEQGEQGDAGRLNNRYGRSRCLVSVCVLVVLRDPFQFRARGDESTSFDSFDPNPSDIVRRG